MHIPSLGSHVPMARCSRARAESALRSAAFCAAARPRRFILGWRRPDDVQFDIATPHCARPQPVLADTSWNVVAALRTQTNEQGRRRARTSAELGLQEVVKWTVQTSRTIVNVACSASAQRGTSAGDRTT